MANHGMFQKNANAEFSKIVGILHDLKASKLGDVYPTQKKKKMEPSKIGMESPEIGMESPDESSDPSHFTYR